MNKITITSTLTNISTDINLLLLKFSIHYLIKYKVEGEKLLI